MSLSRVNAGHAAGQAVLIADQKRKNGFEVGGREMKTFYFFRSAGSIGGEGISLNLPASKLRNQVVATVVSEY